ncbi:MAG: methyltransferase domain-containing protein [Syntrophobacteraceae bacterium]
MTLDHDNEPSPYYMHTGRLPIASRLSLYARRRMFELFMKTMRPTENTSILDLGVTCDNTSQESNYFEQFYPYKHNIVCAGTEDGSHLERQYPGLIFVPVHPGQRLPFSDRQFDIVFSSAVIEHAGGSEGQQGFVQGMLRVSRHFFVTTPNRWFPVEMHTGLPFLHYLPMCLYRAILARTGFRYWASEENLNLLDSKTLRNLFRPFVSVNIFKIRLWGVPSNLIAYGKSQGSI